MATERRGSDGRGSEVRVPGSRADIDAVLKELQEWQAALWVAHLNRQQLGRAVVKWRTKAIHHYRATVLDRPDDPHRTHPLVASELPLTHNRVLLMLDC